MADLAGHKYVVHGQGDLVGLTVRFDVQAVGVVFSDGDVADIVKVLASKIVSTPGITTVQATRYDVIEADITPEP